jgi:hypothetical protein
MSYVATDLEKKNTFSLSTLWTQILGGEAQLHSLLTLVLDGD